MAWTTHLPPSSTVAATETFTSSDSDKTAPDNHTLSHLLGRHLDHACDEHFTTLGDSTTWCAVPGNRLASSNPREVTISRSQDLHTLMRNQRLVMVTTCRSEPCSASEPTEMLGMIDAAPSLKTSDLHTQLGDLRSTSVQCATDTTRIRHSRATS